MAKETTEKLPFLDVVYLCKNTLFCFLATGILLLIGAAFVTYLSVTEKVTELLVIILTAICVFWGGYRSAKNAGRQGLLQGILFGVVYGTILTLAGMIGYGNWSMSQTSWLSILIGILCGAIGGMMGVNTKSQAKSKRKR